MEKLPKLVEQDPKTFTCWAAALKSWMSVNPKSPASWFLHSKEDAIAHWKGFTGDKSGLDVVWGFQFMAAAVGMDFKIFHKANQITGGFLHAKLQSKGPIYLFYSGGGAGPGGAIAHAVVVYRVDKPWGNDATLGVMDPWPGIGLQDFPLSRYQQADKAVVGWPE